MLTAALSARVGLPGHFELQVVHKKPAAIFTEHELPFWTLA